MPEDSPRRVLGIDFGLKRIGIATGNTLTGTARALQTVPGGEAAAERVARVIREWRPERVIIGLPLAHDGSETESSRRARAFAEALAEHAPGIEIEYEDERYSSRAAQTRFAEARAAGRARRRDAAGLDGVAAALILESWLANQAGAQ